MLARFAPVGWHSEAAAGRIGEPVSGGGLQSDRVSSATESPRALSGERAAFHYPAELGKVVAKVYDILTKIA